MRPSQEQNALWIQVWSPTGRHEASHRAGKWLVFVPRTELDGAWETISEATRAGRLGPAAKVSTARQRPGSKNRHEGVVCIYTRDWHDKKDIRRVREALRRLGFTKRLRYKTDDATR